MNRRDMLKAALLGTVAAALSPRRALGCEETSTAVWVGGSDHRWGRIAVHVMRTSGRRLVTFAGFDPEGRTVCQTVETDDAGNAVSTLPAKWIRTITYGGKP